MSPNLLSQAAQKLKGENGSALNRKQRRNLAKKLITGARQELKR